MLWTWAWTALAMPWAVEPERAEAVRRGLASVWPGAPIEVVPLPLTGDGVEERDGRLRWIRDGAEVASAPATDATTEAVLVRSWSRNPQIAGIGWSPAPPPLPLPVPLPLPEPEPAPLLPPTVPDAATPSDPPMPPTDPSIPPTEPADRDRPTVLPAVVIGVREAFSNQGFVDGFRFGARLSLGRWSAEATGFLATGNPARRTAADRDRILSGESWLSPMDLGSGTLSVQRALVQSGAFTLSATLGVEARSYYSRKKPEVTSQPVELVGPFVDAGPELGISLAWTPDPAVALRLTLGDTLRVRRNDLTFTPTISDQPRLWLDVILGAMSVKDPPPRDNGTVRSLP